MACVLLLVRERSLLASNYHDTAADVRLGGAESDCVEVVALGEAGGIEVVLVVVGEVYAFATGGVDFYLYGTVLL